MQIPALPLESRDLVNLTRCSASDPYDIRDASAQDSRVRRIALIDDQYASTAFRSDMHNEPINVGARSGRVGHVRLELQCPDGFKNKP